MPVFNGKTRNLQTRKHDVTSRKEYLIFPPVEYLFPTKHSWKILCKSKHFPQRYKRKCEWVFFSEHSVECTRWMGTGFVTCLTVTDYMLFLEQVF